MISSFILSYSFSKLFIKSNWSRLIFESIKALEINTSTLFNFYFAKNIILLCFFFFFLIIDLYFLIAAAIAQIFKPITELVFLIGIRSKEVKAEIEIHLLIAGAKIGKIKFNII